MTGEAAPDRTVLSITGEDRSEFLQGLVTNDIGRLSSGLVYAALLSPQGKYLADFFLCEKDDTILLDVKSVLAEKLMQRINLYKLRAKVMISASNLHVQRGLGVAPKGGLPDSRHPSLGWRLYGPIRGSAPIVDWDSLRVEHCIPETGIELVPDDTYVLEAGFERLNGVDFRKGCYVGQEVTARMKHKTVLRKGLTTVNVIGAASVGTEVLGDGKPVGILYTQSGGRGIAYLRPDRQGTEMRAGSAIVTAVA